MVINWLLNVVLKDERLKLKEELVSRFNELEKNEVKEKADKIKKCLSNEERTENTMFLKRKLL